MVSFLKNNLQFPYLGFGLGLRPEHYETIIQQKPALDWFEIITENYLISGGKPLYHLHKIREHYPIVMHGVSLSLASHDPLDMTYLNQVRELAKRIEPVWISDHLCWTGIHGFNMHELLPVPYTTETIEHIVSRIHTVQDYLGRPILIENVSSYLTFVHSEMTEWEFIIEIIKRSGCFLLLDINNVYVNAMNHGFKAIHFLKSIPPSAVIQIHLAGHSNEGHYIIDTHDSEIISPVWDLYAEAINRFGPVSTMIERDDHIPPLSDLLIELNQAKKIVETLQLREFS